MHIQNKKLFCRISALVTALVICGTLVVSAFADMTSSLPVRVSSNGVFAVSFDNTVYTYYLPENGPLDATGSNYIVLLCPASVGSATDEKILILLWIEFSSTDWSFIPQDVVSNDSNGNICYRGSFGGTATIKVWYNLPVANTANTGNWYSRDQLSTSIGFLTIIASSNKIISNNYLWIAETTYRQGFNGAGQGSLSGTGVLQGGGTIFLPTPDYDFDISDNPTDFFSNPVYGFVFGMWHGVLSAADIFLNGVSVGGITALNLLISLIVIVVVFFLIKFVVKVVQGG